jgi:tyrosyl-tRNA synthetase
MDKKRIGAYVGIDPTAPSLHVGHLLPMMALFWMYINGFHAVSVLGGATAQIGDPTGRTTSRDIQHSSVRKANMASMHYQLKMIWANVERHAKLRYGYEPQWAWKRELVNNNMWLQKVSILEFLKLVGRANRVGTMLGRDTARNKLEKGDGLSYAEFSYPLLQAWDWWHMYSTKGIQMQIGGADQFGNIIAGIDSVNWIAKNHSDPKVVKDLGGEDNKPVGFTVPLLTTASGEKFGKSAGNAVWLDKEMTSTFDLFGFFMRTADADVERYLKLFTFIPLPEIEKIMVEQRADQSKRVAHRRLAREIVEMIYGTPEAVSVEAQHTKLFGRPTIPTAEILKNNAANADLSASLNPNATKVNSENMDFARTVLPKSLVYNQPIARVLFSAGLVASRSEGHRLASNRGAYVGSQPGKQKGGMTDDLRFTPVANWLPEDTWKFVINDDLLILRVGKWKVKVLSIIPDDEFVARGLTCPGWEEFQRGQTKFPEEDAAKRAELLKKRGDTLAHLGHLKKAKTETTDRVMVNKRGPEEEERWKAFMEERYRAEEGKEPTYVEWLRREEKFKAKRTAAEEERERVLREGGEVEKKGGRKGGGEQ